MLALTLLIALSAGFGMFVSLTERAIKDGSAKAADRFDLLIAAAGSKTQLVLSVVFLDQSALGAISGERYKEIANDPRTLWAAPLAFGDYYDGSPVIGTNAVLINAANSASLTGRVFENAREAVAGAKTGLKIGDRFTPIHGLIGQADARTHKGVSYRVVGSVSFGDAWDRAILVPIESIWSAHGLGRSFSSRQNLDHDEVFPVSAIVVKPKTIAGAYELRSAYNANGTQAAFPAEVLTALYGVLGDISAALEKIAFAARIAAIVVTAIAVTLYIGLKRRHIAALRAFGANARRVFLVILIGASALAIAGMALGVALARAAAWLAANQIAATQNFEAIVTFEAQDFAPLLTQFAILLVALSIACAFSFRYCASYYLKDSF